MNVIAPVIVAVTVNVIAPVLVIVTVDDHGLMSFVSIDTTRSRSSMPRP